MRLPNFLGIGAIVANTDLIVTVPERLAQEQHSAELKALKSPVSFPTYTVSSTGTSAITTTHETSGCGESSRNCF